MNQVRLRKLVDSQFDTFIKLCCLAENKQNDSFLHNTSRLSILEKGKTTYEAKLNCGITTFILGNILRKFIPIKLFKYYENYGEFVCDHVFLKYNDMIIDPSYRQFYTDNRNNALNSYNDYLYNNLPPIFIGTFNELQIQHLMLESKNKKEFTKCSIDKDILYNFKSEDEVSCRLNSFKNIYNSDIVKTELKHI